MKLSNGASLVGFADDLALLVVAEKAWLVEIIANEALKLIAEWLISRSLQLTVCKCEAILVTRRRKYEAPRFEINGEITPLKQEIKYLGVWLDIKWSFKHHVKQATTKASIMCTSLMRLMPNAAGPWPARRQLLAIVVESIQLHGAPTWADCIPAYLVDKRMGAVQRKMNLRIISGWRILSRDVANILSGVPPIRLLALERKEIWVEEEEYGLRQGHLPEEERNIIRAKDSETLFKRWQEEWDSSKEGRCRDSAATGALAGLAKRGHIGNSNSRLCGEEEQPCSSRQTVGKG